MATLAQTQPKLACTYSSPVERQVVKKGCIMIAVQHKETLVLCPSYLVAFKISSRPNAPLQVSKIITLSHVKYVEACDYAKNAFRSGFVVHHFDGKEEVGEVFWCQREHLREWIHRIEKIVAENKGRRLSLLKWIPARRSEVSMTGHLQKYKKLGAKILRRILSHHCMHVGMVVWKSAIRRVAPTSIAGMRLTAGGLVLGTVRSDVLRHAFESLRPNREDVVLEMASKTIVQQLDNAIFRRRNRILLASVQIGMRKLNKLAYVWAFQILKKRTPNPLAHFAARRMRNALQRLCSEVVFSAAHSIAKARERRESMPGHLLSLVFVLKSSYQQTCRRALYALKRHANCAKESEVSPCMNTISKAKLESVLSDACLLLERCVVRWSCRNSLSAITRMQMQACGQRPVMMAA